VSNHKKSTRTSAEPLEDRLVRLLMIGVRGNK